MDEDPPPGIGPHELRELELMLAGEKPMAMFHDDIPEGMEPPERRFDSYVAEGRFAKKELTVPLSAEAGTTLRYYFYALPGEEWRMERLADIQRRLFDDGVETTPELETEIGRLLGYDEADIRAFVDGWFHSGE